MKRKRKKPLRYEDDVNPDILKFKCICGQALELKIVGGMWGEYTWVAICPCAREWALEELTGDARGELYVMDQHAAVVQVLRENGGCATLRQLYQVAPRIQGVTWKTKTPSASIRRIVQNPKYFFRIRPGLWALKVMRHEIPPHVLKDRPGRTSDNSSAKL